jgi:hypothetical protein
VAKESKVLKRLKATGAIVNESGILEKQGKHSHYIAFFVSDSPLKVEKFYRLFIRGETSHGCSRISATPYTFTDGQNYYLLFNADEIDASVIKKFAALLKLSHSYIRNNTVYRPIFEYYRNFVMLMSNHLYLHKCLTEITVDQFQRSMLYYSHPERLTFVD